MYRAKILNPSCYQFAIGCSCVHTSGEQVVYAVHGSNNVVFSTYSDADCLCTVGYA